MSLLTQVHPPIIITLIMVLTLPLNSVLCYNSKKFASYPMSLSEARLFKNLIGDDGRVYACAERTFFAFENNGSIAWTVQLDYMCNSNIAPVHGGSRKLYLVAENRVLKIHPLKIGTSDPAVEVFFGPGEIIGLSVSISSSCVLISVQNRGLFAYRLHGQLIWSAGPVLYQHGYRQGCRKNITDCYFTSVPVIDHCESSIYISNNLGELYSLSVRSPYFKWIQDLSSFGKTFTVTPGNNGRVYVTIPNIALVLALDVSMGNILWQGSIGPLSSSDYEPVIDANGWISIGSLDGYLYSFSPTGDLKKFPRSASVNFVIQVNPVLDCSGYAVYISQTEMEGKNSQIIGEYTYISAMKPRNVVFTSLDPASGFVYWSENDPSKFLLNLSQSDLKHFLLDERTVLAFVAVSRNGNRLPCRSTRQRLASSCSQVKPRNISIYTGNEKTIILFLLFESVLLVLLAALVRHCCIFWKKRKLQSLNLGTFLEKRRSLRLQKKSFDRTITELEQKASEEAVANEVLEKLSDLVKEREDIKRKLSTTYSLGRDGEKSRSKSLLPLYDGKTKSHSFQDSKKGSVTIFHTLSDSTNSEDEEFIDEAKLKGKAIVEEESCSDDEIYGEEYINATPSALGGFVNPLFLERSFSEIEERMNDEEEVKGNRRSGSRSLRRRTMSFSK
ncbi:hypothetical protein ACJIZ3_008170 [Penstemon smallii]|uniref:Protein GAMETE EXPRESSED 3 n=1 Tax=Penstemon smallii TaxID=265156 RepID=A0ABD3T918_9LAMI